MELHKLYGRRVLHFLSPVKFKGNVYKHGSDSNYKVVEKTIKFLPMCHHYVVVPENHTIDDTRLNVTLLKYPYPKNPLFHVFSKNISHDENEPLFQGGVKKKSP